MIEFEHTIFILLLLSGVLNAKPPRPRWAIFSLLLGILLVFFPPAQPLVLPWNFILGIVLPLLLWQNGRRIVNAEWRGPNSVILGGLTVIIFGAAFWLGGALNWPGALLFGLVTTSMVWRASEPENFSSYISLIGPLTLVFLLLEIEAAIQLPENYLGGIFSGASFGLAAAFLGLYLVRKTQPKWHTLIGIGQVYLAYWLTFLAGVSAVTAALLAVMVYIWLNQYFKLGYHQEAPPAPLNTWPGFIFILVLFLLLGWQAHQPISALLILEVFLGMMITFGITWLGRRLDIPAFQIQKPFWISVLRTGVLLFPALLLWPRDLLDQPIQLAVAIGVSVLVIGFSHFGLSFYFPKNNA